MTPAARSSADRAPRDGVTRPAARLVGLLGADDDDRVVEVRGHAVHDALGARRGLAADDADRLELVDALREREQHRHGAERLAAEVEIEAGADHAPAVSDERADDADDVGVEELDLVDADDARLR